MGRPFAIVYGNADVGSAIEDVKSVVAKIETNKFGKKDIVKLYKANQELLVSIIDNEYED